METERVPENVYDPAEAIAAQAGYCWDNNRLNFAPRNGICFSCRKNIYDPGGYSVAHAAANPITGCPFCRRSFCD